MRTSIPPSEPAISPRERGAVDLEARPPPRALGPVWGSLLGFVVAGMAGGVIAGAVDALGALNDPQAGLVLLGSMGFHLLLGALAGAVAGLMYPLLPASLTAVSLVRRAARRLRPGAELGLHERCRTVVTLWLSLGMLALCVELLAGGFRVLFSRVQSLEFAALGAAGLALLVLALGAAVAAPLRAGAARGLEFLVRRRPGLTPAVHPALHLVLGLGVLSLILLLWVRREHETFHALDLRPVASALLIALPMLLIGELLRGPISRVPRGRGAVGVGMLLFFAAAAAAAGLRAPAAREGLVSATGSGRLIVLTLRAPFDTDADGFARVLGGGDCDDENPAIHPGAVDVPGDGVDQDCDGADLTLPPPPPPPPKPEEPQTHGLTPPYNLLLITVDALRADHMGACGYPRPTTPALDRLAEESALFCRAYSPSAKTPTALPALFAGRYPSELLRDGEHFATYAEGNVFLAEVLADAGYRTAGFPSHWYFDPRYGLAQGFAVWQPYFVEPGRMEKVATAETVVTAAVEHFRETDADAARPWFVWLHLLDPHKDYIEHLDVPGFGDEPIDRYDHEIRYVDTWVAWLLETLARRADWARTVIVFTADHGEAFGEHGYRFHGFGLHEDQIRVPLIIRVPGLPGRAVDTAVSLVDLAPTLYSLAGLGPEAKRAAPLGLEGETLLPLLAGGARASRPIYAEMPRGPHNAPQFAWLEGDDKLIYQGEGDAWQLFDLADDPGEQTDRAAAEPARLAELRLAAQRFRARLDVRQPTP
ncbi:MAG: sulfatase-like hydrolase/transferase [Myxococcales bacterium]|nr:sulfatase-like hydrolase/transferase [Myxococcales bacterium]